jgi:hypothetical protein
MRFLGALASMCRMALIGKWKVPPLVAALLTYSYQ